MPYQRFSTETLASLVDAELNAVVNARDFPLYRMMSYHIGWCDSSGQPERGSVGSYTLGVLALLACTAMGGDTDTCLPAAAALELVDKFTEIHDDVQEGNPKRNGKDSVWWVWGPAQAINAGDGMHALGRLALFSLLERGVPAERVFRVVQLVDEASLRACEGRFRDLQAQERIDISVAEYMRMAEDKAGALPACAMRLGGLLADADDATTDALGQCGAQLGIAMQVRSDINALWGNGASQPSVEALNKKKLLPVVLALENASISEKRQMGEIYFKRVLESDDVLRLRDVIEGLGARRRCEDIAAEHIAAAVSALDCDGISDEGRERIIAHIKMLTDAINI